MLPFLSGLIDFVQMTYFYTAFFFFYCTLKQFSGKVTVRINVQSHGLSNNVSIYIQDGFSSVCSWFFFFVLFSILRLFLWLGRIILISDLHFCFFFYCEMYFFFFYGCLTCLHQGGPRRRIFLYRFVD